MKFGSLVRFYRERMGLKVYELADKVGVCSEYMTQIEKHNKLPCLKVGLIIAAELKLFVGEYRDFVNIYLGDKYPEILQLIFNMKGGKKNEEIAYRNYRARFIGNNRLRQQCRADQGFAGAAAGNRARD
jgi:DNA-binding XRE family transcriptional regulator